MNGTDRVLAGPDSGRRRLAGWLLGALVLAWVGLGGAQLPAASAAVGPVPVSAGAPSIQALPLPVPELPSLELPSPVARSLDSGPAPAWAASRLQVAPVARFVPGSPFVPPVLAGSQAWAALVPPSVSLPVSPARVLSRLLSGVLGSRAPPSFF